MSVGGQDRDRVSEPQPVLGRRHGTTATSVLRGIASATDCDGDPHRRFRRAGNKVPCIYWYLAGSSRVDAPLDCFIATFLLGRCVLRVVKTNPQVPVSKDDKWAGHALRLLPEEPATISWPAALPLKVNDLNEFARSGFGTISALDSLPPLDL